MKKIKRLFLIIFLFGFGFGFAGEPDDEYYDEDVIVEYQDDDYYDDYDEGDDTISDFERNYLPTPAAEERGESNYSQRQLDPNFKDNYTGKRFDYDRKKKERKPYSGPSLNLSFLFSKALMYTVLALIVFAIIYYIIKNSGGFAFGKDRRKINYASDVEQLFEDKENIENNDFAKLIQKAKSENNLRLAIRYYFLWVLQSMFDKKLIDWNKDKTNFDYFSELGKSPISEDFFKNTHIYDYIWYGNFELSDSEFKTAESIFQKTLKKLK
ncbi:MAG: hypothetical protein WA897_04935 [Moheibacter sp.]